MYSRSTCLIVATAATVLGVCAPPASCATPASPAKQVEHARAATLQFNRAEEAEAVDADALLEKAISLWEAVLETHPENAEYHGQAAILLSQMIGRAWRRGISPGSEELKPLWHRVAWHRQRVLELTRGQAYQPMSVMEVAYAYQQAGDFTQAERFYKRVGDALVLFRFYVTEKHVAEAQHIFASLSGFDCLYQAMWDALAYGQPELALSCGESVLQAEKDPHHRAAVFCVLAQANFQLRRWRAAVDAARKSVALDPRAHSGWLWLSRAYSFNHWYASAAAVLRHELTLLTGDSEKERHRRGQIYSELGYLYNVEFHRPQKAIECHWRAIEEFSDSSAHDLDMRNGQYMNIIATLVHLRDLTQARSVLREAQRQDPAYWSRAGVRKELRRLGLDSDPADSRGEREDSPVSGNSPQAAQ